MAPMTWLRKAVTPAVVLVVAIGACGRPTPSNVPLGGEDEPVRKKTATSVSEGPASREAPDDEEEEEDEDEEEFEEDEDLEGYGGEGALDEGADGSDEGEKLASTAPVPSAPLCDDATPATFDCRGLTRGCPTMAPLCTVLEGMIKPKVGQALAACIVDGGCEFEGIQDCARDAIRLACVDDAARSFCEDRYEACSDELDDVEATREDCEHAVSSLLPDVRQRFTSCLADSCDLEQCLMRVLPLPR